MHYAPSSSLNFTMHKTTKQTALTYVITFQTLCDTGNGCIQKGNTFAWTYKTVTQLMQQQKYCLDDI